MNVENLGFYLNNHLAGAVAGIELVRKIVEETRDSESGAWFGRFLAELEEDRETVRRLLREIGRSEDTVKKLGGWVMEKVAAGRLSSMAGDSTHLRRVVEIEGILLGTQGRITMWRLLERLHDDRRLAVADFTFLRQRGERQAEELERFRQEQAAAAFLQ